MNTSIPRTSNRPAGQASHIESLNQSDFLGMERTSFNNVIGRYALHDAASFEFSCFLRLGLLWLAGVRFNSC